MRLELDKPGLMWVNNPILQKRPALCEPPEGRTKEHLSDLIKFIWYFADQDDSPCADERDFEHRKTAALRKSGVNSTEIKHIVLDFMVKPTTGTAWLGRCLTEYLRLLNNSLFTVWISQKSHLFSIAQQILSPIDSDNEERALQIRTSIVKEMPDIEKSISLTEQKLFFGVKEVADAVNEAMLEDSLAGYPERFAKPLPK